jgi:protein-S-isoprenylcysteine O-methyltransferase Ste14
MKKKISEIVNHKFFNIFSNVLLFWFYIFFLTKHIVAIKAGSISSLTVIVILMETTVIFLLITRKNPTIRSTDALAWTIAICGTIIPLLLIPSGKTLFPFIGNILMTTGGLLSVIAYLSLNTSFGISPAIRKIKTSGLFKFVRHPIYLSYIIMYIGYINLSFSIYNTIILVTLVIFIILRIHYEEKLLLSDSEYQSYAKKVRHRLIPYIF